jgi:cytochrome c biogenesis protein CcmG/thiol:disulfide interchange protein DsbE
VIPGGATLSGVALALVLLLIPPGAAAAPDWSALGVQPYQPRKPAPEFTLPETGGGQVSLGDRRGKLVLLFFWATW